MAEKNHIFTLLVPLCFEHYSDIRALNDGLKSISFNIDFEKNVCSIFGRTNCDKVILDSVKEFSFASFKDKDFLYYNCCVSTFKEVFVNGLQKKDDEKLVSKKFSQRSWSKKN